MEIQMAARLITAIRLFGDGRIVTGGFGSA
jgi:hypothetical protein